MEREWEKGEGSEKGRSCVGRSAVSRMLSWCGLRLFRSSRPTDITTHETLKYGSIPRFDLQQLLESQD